MRGTPAEVALALQKQKSVWARLRINQLTYVEVNLEDHVGKDVMLEASWGEDSPDSPCGTATFNLIREVGTLNLSPLMETSAFNAGSGGYFPRLWPAASIYLDTATVPKGVTPSEAHYKNVFTGRLDTINIAADEKSMQLTCRDWGGWYINRWIRPSDPSVNGVKFGASGGQAVESAMQDILDYVYGSTFIGGTLVHFANLYVPVSPSWFILEYAQEKMAVLEALRNNLALQFGWDVRFRYDSFPGGDDTFKLTLWDGGASKEVSPGVLAPDVEIGPGQYYKITDLSISDNDIRNVCDIWYGNRQLYTAFDSASVIQYGERYMELVEPRSSNVNTLIEAQRLGGRVMSDLAQPAATHSIELPYFWPIQMGDVHKYLPDDRRYSSPQILSVVGYRHTISASQLRTIVNTRGKPAVAFREWFTGQPQMTFVSTTDPVGPARENAIHFKVDSIAFP
jgi:hypothetical protein